MSCQPLILGYADADVNQAVIKQLKLAHFSLMNKLEVDVTNYDNIPCWVSAIW